MRRMMLERLRRVSRMVWVVREVEIFGGRTKSATKGRRRGWFGVSRRVQEQHTLWQIMPDTHRRHQQ